MGRARRARSSPISVGRSRSANGQPEGTCTVSSSSYSVTSSSSTVAASPWGRPDMERRSITTVQAKEFGDRLMTKQDGRRVPLTGQWELTCRCNLRCVMCYTDCFNHPENIRNELSTSEIIRIMDELAEAGCVELCLTGGEPLARPDFFDIYG